MTSSFTEQQLTRYLFYCINKIYQFVIYTIATIPSFHSFLLSSRYSTLSYNTCLQSSLISSTPRKTISEPGYWRLKAFCLLKEYLTFNKLISYISCSFVNDITPSFFFHNIIKHVEVEGLLNFIQRSNVICLYKIY